MNCPKCGGELIINSNVCPKCDITDSDAPTTDKKPKRKLSFFGKIIVIALFVLVASAVAIAMRVHYSRFEVHGIFDGNRLNSSLVCETENGIYFSAIDKLYCTNKHFTEKELIDTTEDIIENIVECRGSIYYTKENNIYCYNPLLRKKYAVCALSDKCCVIAKSYYDIYYAYNDALYKLSVNDSSFVKIIEGLPVISGKKIYLLSNNIVYETNFDTLELNKIASVSEYSKPAFIKNDKLFCYDYKEQKIFSVSLPDGALKVEFKLEDHQNISDVAHINTSRDYLFFRGENGIYRYDFNSGDILCMSTLGYIEYVNVYYDGLYLVSPDKSAYFIDLNGNITAEINEENS